MGSVRWQCSGVVAAPPSVVYAWLTDFTEDDHNSEAYRRGAGIKPGKKPPKPSRRTILERNGHTIKIRDQWDGNDWTQTVTLDPPTHSYRVDGSFGYVAHWRALPEGAHATRVEFEGSLGKGLVGSIMGLFSAKMQKSMETDFRGHLEDLRESLRTPGPMQGQGSR